MCTIFFIFFLFKLICIITCIAYYCMIQLDIKYFEGPRERYMVEWKLTKTGAFQVVEYFSRCVRASVRALSQTIDLKTRGQAEICKGCTRLRIIVHSMLWIWWWYCHRGRGEGQRLCCQWCQRAWHRGYISRMYLTK